MLVDTSVLLRTLQPHHPLYAVTDRAIRVLPAQGRQLHIVPQNLVELWAVATRPFGENGLGMDAAQASSELERVKGIFTFLPETPAVYPTWELLVRQYNVFGKSSHDARLVAAMQVHGIKDVLTFDRTGFTRYAGIEAVNPIDIVSSATA
jgi:predicted nucleic acid-binding protein